MPRKLHYTPKKKIDKMNKELIASMENLKKIALGMANRYDALRRKLGMKKLTFRQMAHLMHFLFNSLGYGYIEESLLHDYCRFLIYNTMGRKSADMEIKQ